MISQKTFAQRVVHAGLNTGIACSIGLCLIAALQGCAPTSVHQDQDSNVNHLKHELSPYLLAHANDPINWYAWSDEPFARAKRENKPIFLSSGFAACRLSRLMQHQSFQDPATAKLLNDNFVCILVDSEERPYVHEVYNRAAGAMGGQSGSPLTVFLTADKKPFLAGTYFARTEMGGLPSFTMLLNKVIESWHKQKSNIDKMANQLCLAIYNGDAGRSASKPDEASVLAAGEALLAQADTSNGSSGNKSKFPRPGALSLAMQLAAAGDNRAHDRYLSYISSTLNNMARCGIHDQSRGGFFRYSNDAQGHDCSSSSSSFEKMLSDNALIAQSFMDGSLLTGNGQWKKTGLRTLDFCLQEFAAADGSFYGSVYADSVEPQNVDLTAPLPRSGIRQKNASLVLDKKVIAGWNGLMISALVEGYKISGDEKYLQAAKNCAQFLLKNLCQGKFVFRVWAGGKQEISGCLDDYAYLIRALLDLASVDGDPIWLSRASGFNETVIGHFFSHRVGFYYTANNKDQALVRIGCATDGAAPSAAAMEVSNLVRLADINDDNHLKAMVDRTVQRFGDGIKVDPVSYGFLLAAMDQAFDRGERLLFVRGSDQALTLSLQQQFWQVYAPHVVSLAIDPALFAAQGQSALLRRLSISPGDSQSAAYFCGSFNKSCDKPMTDPAQVKAKMANLASHAGL